MIPLRVTSISYKITRNYDFQLNEVYTVGTTGDKQSFQ